MDPWHLWEVTESSVEWCRVFVGAKVLPVIAAWSIPVVFWSATVSTSYADFPIDV